MRKKLRNEILGLMRQVIDEKNEELIAGVQPLKDGGFNFSLPVTKLEDFSTENAEEASEESELPLNERAAEPQKEEPEILNKRAEILRTAEDLINGDRAQTYGPPEVSFGRIADIFNAMGYRHHVQVEDSPLGYTRANKLDAVDAALILIGMKLSRTIGGRDHMDNWIDLAGYSGLGAELASEPTWRLNESEVGEDDE